MSVKTSHDCEHPACGCPKTKGSNFCSDSCKDAADLTEIACQCGHPGCPSTLNQHVEAAMSFLRRAS